MSKKNSRPSISVIIPTYNDATYLMLSVRSMLDQTIPPKEIIIVDDCSRDNTKELLHDTFRDELRKGQIVYLKNTKNLGAAGSRNKGVKRSSGDYVIFIDSDDMSKPQHLETMLATAQKTTADLVAAHTKVHIDSKGHIIYQRSYPFWGSTEYKLFILGTTGCNMLIRRDTFDTLGGFNPKITYAEDWDLQVRAYLAGFMVALNDDGTELHREHDRSITHEFNWTKHRVETMMPVIEEKVASGQWTKRQYAYFLFGTLLHARLHYVPRLIIRIFQMSPLFFVTNPAWIQFGSIAFAKRLRRLAARAGI